MAGITVVPGTGSRRRYYPKYRVSLGPFIKGMNTIKKPNHLDATELQDCVNYIIRPDGTLGARPRAQAFPTAPFNVGVFNPLTNNPIAGDSTYTLLHDNSLAYGFGFAFLAVQDGNGINRFWFYTPGTNGAPGSWAQTFGNWAISGFRASSIVYYPPSNSFYVLVNSRVYVTGGGSPGALLSASPNCNNPDSMYVIKDRLFIVDNGIPNKIYWSKATDFSIWSAPDGGSLNIEANITNAFVLNDALYVCANDGIWRLSFTSDPAVDGTFQRIFTSEQGIRNAIVFNNEIYFVTNEGFYKLVNGYAIELSTPIKNLFIKCLMRNRASTYAILHKIGSLFVIGPFLNLNDTLYDIITGETPVATTDDAGEYYLVYDANLNAWTTWKFAAGWSWNGTTTDGGAASGPVSNQATKPFVHFDGSVYIFTGATKYPGGQVFYMDAKELYENTHAACLDAGRDINNNVRSPYMGFKFKTGLTDLGDLAMWKRIFRVVLTAFSGTPTVTSGPGNNPPSPRNLLLVETTTDVPVTAAQLTAITDKNLHFGASYRGKAFGLEHNAVAMGVTAGEPLYNEIQKIEFSVSLSQPVST